MFRFKVSSLKDKELTDYKVRKHLDTIITPVYLGNAGFNSKMNEWGVFYSDLSDGSACVDMGSFSSFLTDLNEIPSLVEKKKNFREGKLGYGECYNALQTFQKNKSHGKDGLTVEFYLAFGPCLEVCWWKV